MDILLPFLPFHSQNCKVLWTHKPSFEGGFNKVNIRNSRKFEEGWLSICKILCGEMTMKKEETEIDITTCISTLLCDRLTLKTNSDVGWRDKNILIRKQISFYLFYKETLALVWGWIIVDITILIFLCLIILGSLSAWRLRPGPDQQNLSNTWHSYRERLAC